jgi:hypothetical protein
MSPFSMGALSGTTIHIPESYDSRVHDHVATLYYFEHNDMREVTISFIEMSDDSLHVKVSGKACSPWTNECNEDIEVSVDCIVHRVDR